MSEIPADPDDQRRALVELYDDALPQVYGYLLPRTGSIAVAEDLTAETFLAAVDAVRRRAVPDLTVAWLITVARNKMVDHWRRQERDAQLLHSVSGDAATEPADEWDVHLEALVAQETLTRLGPHHRGALVLRYLDALPVREVAACLGRTEGATEVLLVRARAAFRREYEARTAETGSEDR